MEERLGGQGASPFCDWGAQIEAAVVLERGGL